MILLEQTDTVSIGSPEHYVKDDVDCNLEPNIVLSTIHSLDVLFELPDLFIECVVNTLVWGKPGSGCFPIYDDSGKLQRLGSTDQTLRFMRLTWVNAETFYRMQSGTRANSIAHVSSTHRVASKSAM